MKQYDYLFVGAGLFNAVVAHEMMKRGKRCLIIDRREHTGGNIYCQKMSGINVHKYGAHIFHTSNKVVWEYVNKIVEFNRYTNSPVASYKGKLYNLPFNMNTFYQMWGLTTPKEVALKLEEQRKEAKERMLRDGAKEPRNLEEQAQLLIGKDIYEALIKGYTEKQWGRECTELPPFIIKRLPVRMVFDNNYFSDDYQGIPRGGYNVLIEGLLQGAEVRLSVDYLTDKAALDAMAETVVYTGAVDEYFAFSLGKLDWRTIRFETETLQTPNFQGNAVVNYTAKDVPYTRIIEHKHFEMFGDEVDKVPQTVISKEFSSEWTPGAEPYYPVNDDKNARLFARYQALAKA